jgi:hypothetical protein
MHVGLQDWASEIDMRKLTLAEITLLGTYTYSMADLRATVGAAGARRLRRPRLGRVAPAGRRPGGIRRPARRPQRGGEDRAAALSAGRQGPPRRTVHRLPACARLLASAPQ